MNRSYSKDIWRTIVKSKKRFFSIMIITMLGVTMLTGLKAGCVDLRRSADRFYDEQNVYDIQIVSTLGLTGEDIAALQLLDGISAIEGAYEESAEVEQQDTIRTITIRAMSTQGINMPYVLEGKLPSAAHEVAVSESYAKHTGTKLGDRISIQPTEDSSITQTSFVLTAIVQDPLQISVADGLVSFRSSTTQQDTFYASTAAFDHEVYTSIYVTLDDTMQMDTYSDAYEQRVNEVISSMETIKKQREQASYDALVQKAQDRYLQAQQQGIQVDQDITASIPKATWYIQDRNALSSYASLESDASSIETVGNAFPIVFLIVAILISLTTITRMVEEERGLIGTYKALGFSDVSIYAKYLIYALSACLLGGVLGDICGFVFLPKFLFTIFQVLYELPFQELSFHAVYGIGGVLIFVIGIVIAAILACHAELKQMPAILMRPKSPRAGSRVVLEYLPFLWKRLSFLNKVTLRNLFRFKKRMMMTIGGIMGCTALVLCGFAIKDSVSELMPAQYEHIYQYDLMGVVSEDAYATFDQELSEDKQIHDYIGIRMDTVKVKAREGGQEESVQLMVIPNGVSLEGYLGLEDVDGSALVLQDGMYITQNASQVLDFDEGDTIYLQDTELTLQAVQVTQIVQNYLGNTIYMTQQNYEQLFKEYKPNAFLAHFSKTCEDQIQYTEGFGKKDNVLSSVSVKQLKDQFSDAFSLINAVVYLMTGMAAGLAFVVLFTLSTTNISERERELATIKVLGFFDHEVHVYVNKETLILTVLGVLCGLPLGTVLSGMLTSALHMPSIHFAVTIYPISYLYAALLSLGFALIVNLMTNFTLNHINMVEALKSNE